MERIKPTLFLFLFLIFPVKASVLYTHLLWEKPIGKALNNRDVYYQRVGISPKLLTFDNFWNLKESEELKEQIELHKDENSPWFHLLSGIISSSSSIEKAVLHFNTAMSCVQDSPAETWVLFIEFRRSHQKLWAEKCLKRLEYHFLVAGAQSAPVISQQLLSMAKYEKTNGNNDDAERYIEWSSRFEHYPFWQKFIQAYYYLPFHLILFFNKCNECLRMICSSWLLQLTIFYYIYKWIHFATMFFITIIFIIISISTLPIALHPLIEIFPTILPTRLKYLLCTAIFISLSVFGIVPFLFLTAAVLLPHLQKKDKILLSISVLLLILSPIDARIQEMFRVTLSPDRTLGFFRRAASEGWHAELEKSIKENLNNNDSDYISYVSAAILDLKRNNPASSISNIMYAEKLNPNDPVLLITAGNIFFSVGNMAKARSYYKKCIEKFPKYESALFNLGQLNLYLMNASKGSKQLSKAALLNPELVNRFIEKNESYFPGLRPSLRQFIQPDYKIGYFWKHVFPSHCGSWKSTKKIWGATFFGIPPLIFLLIALLLLIILLSIKRRKVGVKIFFCKLCGSPMCRKCRVGLICRDCSRATDTIRNETLSKRVRMRIQKRSRHLSKLTIHILNFFFPGAGDLKEKQKITFNNMAFTIITSFVYALYISFLTFNFYYPLWVIKNSFIAATMCLIIFNFFFIVRASKAIFNELRLMGEENGA